MSARDGHLVLPVPRAELLGVRYITAIFPDVIDPIALFP